jgi:hypothetical protein
VLPGDPAFAVESGTLSGADLVAAGEALGLERGARVLTTSDFTDVEQVVRGLLAPLAAGGSVVLCRNLDHARLDKRVADEKVTTTLV